MPVEPIVALLARTTVITSGNTAAGKRLGLDARRLGRKSKLDELLYRLQVELTAESHRNRGRHRLLRTTAKAEIIVEKQRLTRCIYNQTFLSVTLHCAVFH